MKCKKILVMGWKNEIYKERNSKIQMLLSLSPDANMDDYLQGDWQKHWVVDHTEPCDGTIRVSVSAQEEPYFGGVSAELYVNFSCSKCKMSDESLPDQYNFNEWLQSILDKVD